MNKTKKNNNEKTEVVKPFFEDHIDTRTMRKIPVTIEYINELGKHLVKWASFNDDALLLTQFYVENGLSGDSVRRFGERSPLWKKAIKTAKMAIGVRRELGALKKKYSENVVLKTLAFYGSSWDGDQEDWKAMETWRSDLRKAVAEAKSKGNIKVFMESFVDHKHKEKDAK